MGCCNSRESSDGSPYSDSTTPTSSHAINTQPAPEPASIVTRDHSGASPGQAQAASRRRRRSQQPLDQHINKPLRRHEWTSKNKRWSRAALDLERTAFFDTRVTGRPEVWLTLRAVLEVLWQEVVVDGDGDEEGDDGAGPLETAQAILDAAEITLPTGDLTQGAYDNLGNYYAFHEWIVSDPTNLVASGEEEEEEEEEEGQDADADGGIWRGRANDEEPKGMSPLGEVSGGEDDEALRRREEKGKAVVDVRDLITVYARLSEDARDIKLSVAKTESVRSVARKVIEESGLPTTKRVRIAYLGKMLKENASLEDQGWRQGHVINAMVFTR